MQEKKEDKKVNLENYEDNSKKILNKTIDKNDLDNNSNEKFNDYSNNEINQLKKKNVDLLNEIEFFNSSMKKLEDRNLRLCAEMENVRRRSQKDIENAYKFSLEKFIQALLPVLDSIEKAIEVSSNYDNVQDVSEGIKLTMKMLKDIMKKFEINQIYPKGELFNPNKHEAVATQTSSKMNDNEVISVFQTGYELNNRVIRPARVLVVKNS